MSSARVTRPVRGQRRADADATRLTRWSHVMLPVAVAWMSVLSTVWWVLRITFFYRTAESAALTVHGIAGLVVLIVLDVLGICPAIVGGWLALRALRCRARTGAWVGLVLTAPSSC